MSVNSSVTVPRGSSPEAIAPASLSAPLRQVYWISYLHPTRDAHFAVDAEGQRLGRVDIAAVAAQRAERIHVRAPGVRVARGDQAATDMAARDDHRPADPHRAPDPA